MKKSSNHDGAAPKEDVALFCRRCGEKHKKNHISSNQNEEILKRRRCDKPKPKPAHNIPEARVVQEPWDCALVSDSDREDDRRDSYIAERLLQESIERHTRLFTFRRNPEFFVVVHHRAPSLTGGQEVKGYCNPISDKDEMLQVWLGDDRSKGHRIS
eukprot:scaffold11689_cov172-Skeletonema_marinoi.AAC.2